MAFSAVSTAETRVRRVAGLSEHSLSDVINLAAANHILRIPLLHIIGGPGLPAVMAVSATKTIV